MNQPEFLIALFRGCNIPKEEILYRVWQDRAQLCGKFMSIYIEDPEEAIDRDRLEVVWQYFNSMDEERQWYIAVGVRVVMHLAYGGGEYLVKYLEGHLGKDGDYHHHAKMVMGDLSRAIWSPSSLEVSGSRPETKDGVEYIIEFPDYEHNSHDCAIVQNIDVSENDGSCVRRVKIDYRILYTFKTWSEHEHEDDLDRYAYRDTRMADGEVRSKYVIRWSWSGLDEYSLHFFYNYIKLLSKDKMEG